MLAIFVWAWRRIVRNGHTKAVSLSLAAVVMLSACAPHVQGAMQPPAAFAGPQITMQANGTGIFTVQDGAHLPFRRWSPSATPETVFIALHGFNDTSASWRLAGPWWAEQGIEVWAYDQRGFGAAPNRGEWADPAVSLADLRTVTALVRAQRPNATIAIVGESMGGAMGINAFASDNPPAADKLILVGPAVWGWSSQGTVNAVALWTGAMIMGDSAFEAPAFATRKIRASDNTVELLRNGRDPQFLLRTRIDSLYGLVNLMEDASRNLGKVQVPTLLAYGAYDVIVPRKAMSLALERAGPMPNLRTAYYPEGWHILNRDLEAQDFYADVAAWVEGKPLPSNPSDVANSLLQN